MALILLSLCISTLKYKATATITQNNETENITDTDIYSS